MKASKYQCYPLANGLTLVPETPPIATPEIESKSLKTPPSISPTLKFVALHFAPETQDSAMPNSPTSDPPLSLYSSSARLHHISSITKNLLLKCFSELMIFDSAGLTENDWAMWRNLFPQ